MRIKHPTPSQRGSVLIIVLWIALGLVSITLYFANSMSFELRASDNRVSGLETEEAIDGAARYVGYVLANYATNGAMPAQTYYQSTAVPVGDAHFWLIGRDTNNPAAHPDQVSFGLTDEGSKLNLNIATYGQLVNLPRILPEFAANIVGWRTNGDTADGGVGPEAYSMLSPSYELKSGPFETVDELRLVYGADFDMLVGEDANHNGILDPGELDENRNTLADPGITEYTTVYSREPNTRADGSPRINVASLTANDTNTTQLRGLLQTNISAARATEILTTLGLTGNNGGGGPGGGGGGNAAVTSRSPLHFYTQSGMTVDEFALVANDITVNTNTFIEGRVNVNTASAAVLACIPGLTNRADDLVAYRQSNPDKLTSVAWVLDALSVSGNDAVQIARQIRDRITTQSYQFTADVAAVGPYGRGYRRVRFVFDTSEGAPRIIYRRDLTHLGWALGKDVRQVWLAKNTQQ